MDSKTVHDIEKREEERIRKVIREENAALLSALIQSFQQVIEELHQKQSEGKSVEKEEIKPENREKTVVSLYEQDIYMDLRKMKGVRKQTIELAKIIAESLRRRGPLKLKEIKMELQKYGKDLGSNSTTRMKSIMKICPGIKKAGHGRYVYEN
ncbi:hypothetical protein GCM10007416_02880 [Kroppenstedtia guangzhouensis]|uniref:Repressor Rok winged helix domain-containing protein n=1 Tax=Kroppenstedtia guangzhouensis TaxID=1274356 RepID=A0ABQ1FXW4_9BACL|nr:hypothetical protein [Kroppenstedtia guangzhouensis]GGA33582.1 hypothetical protein GCM10007416_02880 [Kroppenstedtia guangzhouensis]